jgi:hypothetical protein
MMPRRWPVICLILFAPLQAHADNNDAAVSRIANRIDRSLEATWKANGTQPGQLADDATFFRRMSLDLTGCIPTAADARTFLEDKRLDKRRIWARQLLAGPLRVRHTTNVWRDQLFPAGTGIPVQSWPGEIDAWLRIQLRDRVPYDRFAREILTTSLTFDPTTPNGNPDHPKSPSPLPFYRANDFKPESLASSVSQVFLGISLDCAQCHNHPFAPWTKEQFAEFAGFFTGPTPTRMQAGRVVAAVDSGEAKPFALPNSKPVSPRFLDGVEPKWVKGTNPRTVLADWVVSPENPYFTRHAVNRLWGQLFGVELVSDEDSPNKDLQEELARELVREKFDLNIITAGIVASKTYQRESRIALDGTSLKLFARMRIRGLSADQLYDNMIRAAGFREPLDAAKRAEFLARFQQVGESNAERQTSVLQVLNLMNGPLVNDAVNLERGPTLMAVVEAPWLNTGGRVDGLYFATLSRPPREEERARWIAAIEKRENKNDRRQALADLMWALLNGSEFLFNH